MEMAPRVPRPNQLFRKKHLVGPIVSDSYNKLILTDNLDGAEIHEENNEREDGSSQASTQTTETQVVLDSEAQQAYTRRIGREAPHFDRCLYSP